MNTLVADLGTVAYDAHHGVQARLVDGQMLGLPSMNPAWVSVQHFDRDGRVIEGQNCSRGTTCRDIKISSANTLSFLGS